MNYKFKLPSWSIVCCALLGAALVVPIYGQSKLSKQDAELIEAVQGNNLKRVQAALAHGANVNVRDYFGETPLSMAVRFHIGGGYHLTPIKPEDDPARRPGAFAVNEQIEQYLLDHGADIEARDGMGDTVLISALDSYVREQNLQWVLSHHPNIEVTDHYGNTPLCLLSQGDSELGDNELKMQLLLDHGANTETQCRHNATALIMASMKGRVEAVALLLDHGANINAVDNDGYTSLMHACSSDAPESLALAKVLLDHGADLEIRAKDGSSAMDLTLYPWSATHRTLSAMLTDAKNGRRSALLERKSRLEQTLSTGRCDRAQSSPSDRTTCFQGIATLYYSSPSDELWNTAMGIGLALKPIPTEVPQESRKYFVQANDVFKNSQGDADAKKAIVLYRQALVQAPWFAEAWNNLSLAQEKVADYKGAASSLKNFMLVRPEAANDQVRLDHIYLLEGKAK